MIDYFVRRTLTAHGYFSSWSNHLVQSSVLSKTNEFIIAFFESNIYILNVIFKILGDELRKFHLRNLCTGAQKSFKSKRIDFSILKVARCTKTSLAATGALVHRLQRRTKNTKWPLGGPKNAHLTSSSSFLCVLIVGEYQIYSLFVVELKHIDI